MRRRWRAKPTRKTARAGSAAAGAAASLSAVCLLHVFLYQKLPRPSIGISIPTKNHAHADCPTYGCALYSLEVDNPMLSNGSSFGSTFAMVTRQSNTHEYNQDRSFVFPSFITNQTPRDKESLLVAILDGHSVEGHRLAAYAAMAIPERLAEKLNSRPCCQPNDWVKQQLIDTFVEVDAEAPPNALRGGCTASVSLRIGDKIFFANAGDSMTILARKSSAVEDGYEVVYQTRKDKAHLPSERARIESMGGSIHIPPKFPNESRVVVYSVFAIPAERIGLAMSRSIGDWEWGLVGVIPDPIVDVIVLEDPETLFLVAASDGVWDLRKPMFFLNRFGSALFDASRSSLLASLVDTFYNVAPQNAKWYRDDMTAVVASMLHT